MAPYRPKGVGVALVTPFKEDKSIDYNALANIIDYVIDNKADFLVVLGTTGEQPTLWPEERIAVFNFVKNINAGRVPLVAGVGGYHTAAVIKDMQDSCFEGYDAFLSVTPPYSKPTQEGIYQHFKAIADASPLPVILYDIPGRTGVEISFDTIVRLANDCKDKIVGIKDATGNHDKLIKLQQEFGFNLFEDNWEKFSLLCGEDSEAAEWMFHGASGVISVTANLLPFEVKTVISKPSDGSFMSIMMVSSSMDYLNQLLFKDGNPAGIKCALSKMGFIKNELRLPLVPTDCITLEDITRTKKEFAIAAANLRRSE